MPTKNQRRVDALERMVKDAGMLDAKIDVTRYFQTVRDAYGMHGDIEPVTMRVGDWERLSETIIQLYG